MDEITRNDSMTVGTSSVRVAHEQERKVIYLKNTSPGVQVITVNLGPKAAENDKGTVLDVGEMMIDCDSEAYRAYQGEITAISTAAGGQLSIFER